MTRVRFDLHLLQKTPPRVLQRTLCQLSHPEHNYESSKKALFHMPYGITCSHTCIVNVMQAAMRSRKTPWQWLAT